MNDFESIENACKLGGVDYGNKPFTVDYLEDTIATEVAKHLVHA